MHGIKPWVYLAVLLGAIALAVVVYFVNGKTADGEFSDHLTNDTMEIIETIDNHENDILSNALDLISMS